MALRNAGYDGEPRVSKRLWRSNWKSDHVQMDYDQTIDYNDNGGVDCAFGKDNGKILGKDFNKSWKLFGG